MSLFFARYANMYYCTARHLPLLPLGFDAETQTILGTVLITYPKAARKLTFDAVSGILK